MTFRGSSARAADGANTALTAAARAQAGRDRVAGACASYPVTVRLASEAHVSRSLGTLAVPGRNCQRNNTTRVPEDFGPIGSRSAKRALPARKTGGGRRGSWQDFGPFGREKTAPEHPRVMGVHPGCSSGVAPAARAGPRIDPCRKALLFFLVSDLPKRCPRARAGPARCPASTHLRCRAFPERSAVASVRRTREHFLGRAGRRLRGLFAVGHERSGRRIGAARQGRRTFGNHVFGAFQRGAAGGLHPGIAGNDGQHGFLAVDLHAERGVPVTDQPRRRGDPNLRAGSRANPSGGLEAAGGEQDLLFAVATELRARRAPRASARGRCGRVWRRSLRPRRGR